MISVPGIEFFSNTVAVVKIVLQLSNRNFQESFLTQTVTTRKPLQLLDCCIANVLVTFHEIPNVSVMFRKIANVSAMLHKIANVSAMSAM